MRRLGPALALGTILLAAGWIWSSVAPTPDPIVAAAERDRSTDVPALPLSASRTTREEEEESRVGHANDEPRVRRGRLRVVDSAGEEASPRDGYFTLALDGGGTRQVGVRAGLFSLEDGAPPGSMLSSLVLGGQGADFESPLLPAWRTHDELVELRARWSYLGGLRVLDRRTSLDLTDVTVLAAQHVSQASWRYPPEEAYELPTVALASSPFAMPASPEARTVWVGAPGFAWARIPLLVQDSEVRVSLEPGGSLRTRILAHDRMLGPHFARLYEASEQVAARHVVPGEDAVFDGLAPGDYRLRVELGKPGSPRTILAEAPARIEAGAETTVAFVPTELRPPPGALFVAVVFAGGEEEPTALIARHADPAVSPFFVGAEQLRRSAPGRLEAKLQNVEPGTWQLALSPWGETSRVEVRSGGTSAIAFEVAPLSHVRVFVTVENGEPLPTPFLHWRPALAPPDTKWLAIQREGDQPFEFRCEPGPIELQVVEKGYSTEVQRFEVAPEVADLLMQVPREPYHALEVTLVSGGTRVPLALDAWSGFQLGAVRHEGRLLHRDFSRVKLGTSFASSRMDFLVSQPGLYWLEPPTIPGFRVRDGAEGILLEVLPDELTRLELSLEPDSDVR